MQRTFKILLPAIPLAAIGFAAIEVSIHHAAVHDAPGSVRTQATIDSQTVPPVDVTVNGQPIQLPPNGHAQIDTGSGQATIDAKGNGEVQTQVEGNVSNVNISISTDSTSGNSRSNTVFSTNSSQNTSTQSSVHVSTNGSVTTH